MLAWLALVTALGSALWGAPGHVGRPVAATSRCVWLALLAGTPNGAPVHLQLLILARGPFLSGGREAAPSVLPATVHGSAGDFRSPSQPPWASSAQEARARRAHHLGNWSPVEPLRRGGHGVPAEHGAPAVPLAKPDTRTDYAQAPSAREVRCDAVCASFCNPRLPLLPWPNRSFHGAASHLPRRGGRSSAEAYCMER
jgi:hypothetical protein